MRKKIWVIAGATVLFLALAELLFVYFKYRPSTGRPALVQALREITENPKPRHPNPFIQLNPRAIGRASTIHPYVDFIGVTLKNRGDQVYDYFGFRNRSQFVDAKAGEKWIVLTGGSEVAGFSHRVSIAENLQKILNEREPGETFKVLNLGMNNYTIANEINSYVHLGYWLKPTHVISISGWNDAMFASSTAPLFQKLDLIHNPALEYHLWSLYSVNFPGALHVRYQGDPHYDMVGGFLRNLEKYQRIVESGESRFLSVIQSYNPHVSGKKYEQAQLWFRALQKRGKERGSFVLSDVNGLKHVDSVHTDEASSFLTAETLYRLLKPSLSGAHLAHRRFN